MPSYSASRTSSSVTAAVHVIVTVFAPAAALATLPAAYTACVPTPAAEIGGPVRT